MIYGDLYELIDKIVEIVFSNKHSEYTEDEIIEVLKPYKFRKEIEEWVYG